MNYRFGHFTLDPESRSLRRAGVEVKLEAKVFDLLAFLIEIRPRFAPRSEIEHVLWPSTRVSPDALHRLVKVARRAVEDDGSAQRTIRTVRGRGYAFVAEATLEARPRPSGAPASPYLGTDGYPHGLSAPATRLLRFAAAIADEFDESLLDRAAAGSGVDVGDAIREATDAGFLVRPTAGRLAFIEPKTRHALYASLVAKPREHALTHRSIADALESEGHGDRNAADLAHHFARAAAVGGVGKAIHYGTLAAERASARRAYDSATEHLEHALALSHLASSSDDFQRADLLLRLGRARAHSQGLVAARATYLQVASLARKSDDVHTLGLAALGYADRQATADDDVVALLEEAWDSALRRLPASPISTVLTARLASALRNHDARRAQSLIAQAVSEARRSGDPWTLAHCLEDSARVGLSGDDPEGWIELNEEVCRMARLADEPELEFHGAHGVVAGRLEVGDVVGVRRALDVLESISDRLRTPAARAVTRGVRTMLALLEGRFEAARIALEAAQSEVEASRHPDLVAQMRGQLFYLLRETGNVSVLEPALEEQVHDHPESPSLRATWLSVRAATVRGTAERAELRRLVGELDALPRDRQWLVVHALLAEASAELDASDVAEDVYRRIERYGGLVVVVGYAGLCFGAVDHYLGLLARVRGELARAEDHLVRAVELHRRMGATPFEARSERALADVRAVRTGAAIARSHPSGASAHLVLDRLVEHASAANHVRLYARDADRGPYLTILPSLGRGVEDYTEAHASTLTTRLVEGGYRVLLVQPRGIGRSTGDLTPANTTMQGLAGDLRAVFEALGVERITLVGHAFGNRLARTFATLHPDEVDGLVLMAAGGHFALDERQSTCLRGSFDLTLPDDERLELIRCAFFADGNDPRVWLDGWYPAVAAAQMRAATSIDGDLFKRAGGKRFLLVQAAQDFIAPPDQAGRVLAAELGEQVTYVEISDTGHALAPERPDAIARAILDYLADTRGRTGG